MPGCTGLELAAVIRQQEAYVSVPIVYLSAETDVDKQLAAMRLGGDSFLSKPIRREHLISAVRGRVERLRVLRSFMVRDSLTGLLNHTVIKEQLALEVARTARVNSEGRGMELCFALVDIDHFKLVNDTYGHPTGDRVIKSISRLLQQRLRKSDMVGRYGGEEFAIILPNTGKAGALELLDELRRGFSQVRHQSEGREFYVTFSAGIAQFSLQLANANQLCNAADRALYEAKARGRNCVAIANP
jgi:diguanylate cyclase (GGDEF)-like protein